MDRRMFLGALPCAAAITMPVIASEGSLPLEPPRSGYPRFPSFWWKLESFTASDNYPGYTEWYFWHHDGATKGRFHEVVIGKNRNYRVANIGPSTVRNKEDIAAGKISQVWNSGDSNHITVASNSGDYATGFVMVGDGANGPHDFSRALQDDVTSRALFDFFASNQDAQRYQRAQIWLRGHKKLPCDPYYQGDNIFPEVPNWPKDNRILKIVNLGPHDIEYQVNHNQKDSSDRHVLSAGQATPPLLGRFFYTFFREGYPSTGIYLIGDLPQSKDGR